MGRVKRLRMRKKLLNKCSVMSPEEYNEVFQLQKWLNIKNLNFKIKIFDGSGRGVKSNKKIDAGEELVAIPLEAMITINIVKESRISTLFSPNFPSPETAIAFWLMYEKHLEKKSKYFDYLNVLPKYFDSLLYCTNQERRVLPTWILKPVEEKLKQAMDTYKLCLSNQAVDTCNCCGKDVTDIFSQDLFLWAWLCVNSRCVYFEDEQMNEDGEIEPISSIAMAPYLDFFNHSNHASVEAKLDWKRRVYSLTTNTPYGKNEQIFIKYGAFSNLRLLIEYGFILDDEDQDVVEFTLEEVLKAAKLIDPKYADVSKLKYKFITMNSLNVQLSKSRDEFSWNCNGLLYILVTQDTNLAELLSKTYSSRWSESESLVISEIQQKLLQMKEESLSLQLVAMETIQPCTPVFTVAKNLVKQYIRILKNR